MVSSTDVNHLADFDGQRPLEMGPANANEWELTIFPARINIVREIAYDWASMFLPKSLIQVGVIDATDH